MNRGANGIDGIVHHARYGCTTNTLYLIGYHHFNHDMNGIINVKIKIIRMNIIIDRMTCVHSHSNAQKEKE